MPGALLVVGKRPGRRRQLNHLRAGGVLVVLRDEVSGKAFLVDTGASCSVLPFSSPATPSGPPLTGADGKNIPSWGSKQLTVRFSGRPFSFTFILAAVSRPILGNDFLAAFNLMVDPAKRRVLDALSLLPLVGTPSSSPSSLVAALQPSSTEVRRLLAAFPTVCNPIRSMIIPS